MKRLIVWSMGLAFAGTAWAAGVVDSVAVRQDWPWSANVVVSVTVSGADAQGVDLAVRAYDGETDLGAIPVTALTSGTLYGATNGVNLLAFDPDKVFAGASTRSFQQFRVDVTVVGATDPYIDRVEYRVIDLVTGQTTDLKRRDFYEHPTTYGAFTTDYTTIGPGFTTALGANETFIWTQLNSNDVYKTTKMAFKRIPAGGVTWTMGPSQTEIDAGVSKTNGEWNHPRMGEGQKLVQISKDYFLAVFELTQEQCYRLCGRKLSYYTNVATRAKSPIEWEKDDVGGVSSPQVPALLATYHDFGLKLPTEAQWEFAARCGYYDYLLPNGKECTNDNYGELEGYSTTRGHRGRNDDPNIGGPYLVGKGRPNAYGLWNMLGNVRERTRDNACTWPATHNHFTTSNPIIDPTVASACLASNYYTIKGGSFSEMWKSPANRFANTGGNGFYTNVAQTGWRLVIEGIE